MLEDVIDLLVLLDEGISECYSLINKVELSSNGSENVLPLLVDELIKMQTKIEKTVSEIKSGV